MLAPLMDYARRRGLVAEPGFAPKTVPWVLDCTSGSAHVDVLDLGDPEQKRNRGRAFAMCPDLTQGELIGGSEARAHFLVETAEVVALYGKGGAVATARGARHTAFLALLRQADSAYSGLARVADLIAEQMDAVRKAMADAKVKPTDKVTLRIDGRFPVESDSWHEWWRAYRRSLNAAPAAEEQGRAADPRRKRTARPATTAQRICLLTGELTEPLRVQPKIVGLADVGGSPMGDALVSFDKDSFPSFGFEQGQNAPMSEAAFTLCRSALNDLIANSSQRLVGVRVVHWFKDRLPPEDNPFTLLAQPGDDEGDASVERSARRRAQALLTAITSGERPDLGTNRYHVLTLSGAGGRVMVRAYEEGAFESLAHNVCAWFEDLAIVRRDGMDLARDPKFLAVVGATVRDLSEAPAPLVSALWHAALSNAPIPTPVLAQALQRARVDVLRGEAFNHARMGLLRAYHVRRDGGDSMTSHLNPDHPDPAYHCGRLLAVLAALQYDALGDVGAGVVQRYYVAASQSPALTFSRLLANAKNHLQKLDGGLAYVIEGRIADVMTRLSDAMPRTLDLERQSIFALGYYQQIASDRARKAESKEAKKAARAAAHETTAPQAEED